MADRGVMVASGGVTRARDASTDRLPMSLLAIGLGLSLWVAVGNFANALADGLGSEPVRRGLVGGVTVAASGCAFLWRRRLAEALCMWPWLVLAIAFGQVLIVSVDGFVQGQYVAWTLTALAPAVVAARSRTVWLCVLLLSVSYTAGVLIERSPRALADGGHVGDFAGALLSYPVAAMVLMGLRGGFVRFVCAAPDTLSQIRRDPQPRPPLTISAGPDPYQRLTPAERRVVEALARGLQPKQVAHQSGVSLATVRAHIHNAKRKTSTRTLPELAALSADSRWGREDDQ